MSDGHVFTFAPVNSSYRKMIKAIHYLTWPSDRRKPEGGGSDNNHPCVDSNQIFNNLITSVGLSALFSIRNSVAPRHGYVSNHFVANASTCGCSVGQSMNALTIFSLTSKSVVLHLSWYRSAGVNLPNGGFRRDWTTVHSGQLQSENVHSGKASLRISSTAVRGSATIVAQDLNALDLSREACAAIVL